VSTERVDPSQKRRSLDAGAVSELQGIGRFKFHEGGLEEFKRLAARCMEIVRAKDTGTLHWEAIALHASHGLAERCGLLTYLTHKGVFIDAGRIRDAVADELRKEVLDAYPKPTDGPYIAEAIVAHGQRSPAAAPPGSLAAHLILQQRQAPVATTSIRKKH
jgi:hypothetical protein